MLKKFNIFLLLSSFPSQAIANDCIQEYSKHESWSLTAPNWYENTESIDNERYSWWRSRRKFQPISAENTTIAGVIYTQSDSILKMTVLFPPLYPDENRIVSLRVQNIVDTQTMKKQRCEIKEFTWHCTFRIDNIPPTKYYVFRLKYQPNPQLLPNVTYYYDGVIPKQFKYPKVAAMSCFGKDSTWKKDELTSAVLSQNPDVIALLGDQVYGQDNLAYYFLELIYSINKLTRIMPTIIQMDDHDYGLGNLWGAGNDAEDSGAGFEDPSCVINALEDLQLGHLPDPVSSKTLANGITIRYTNYMYGNVDFAILEARKFKNSEVGDSLLGSDQEEWLQGWCKGKDNSLKVVLAQTPFASLATGATNLWEHKMGVLVEGSIDTNGYPVAGRNRFMDIVKDCSSLVISGDQHLGIAVTYDDYGISECVSPAAINDVFWRINTNPLGGSYVDHFGHQYTLHNAWNVDESFQSTEMPCSTTNFDNVSKSRRAEGFLIVGLDGENASCEMHSYRVTPELVWKVKVPASMMLR